MVNMVQLRDADWAAWERAAKGWRNFADQAVYAGKDIRRQGKDKLDEHWQDRVGEAAGKVLGDLSTQYDCASDLMRGIAMVLEGLAQAVEVAQRQLGGAVDMARTHHLRVNDDGTAAPYDGYAEAVEHRPVVERMVRDAVEAATQADDLAAKQLARLRDSTSITDSGKALDEFQAVASQAEITMLHFALPHGQDPTIVAAWWNSLSDAQRRELELAVPVELADLNGVPDDVKQRLRGPGPLDRVEMVRFSLAHWNDTSIDKYDNNCTQFASVAMKHAGAEENSDWTDDSLWKLGRPTHSWAGANQLHEYLTTKTMSHEVPLNEARPGDLIFLKQEGSNDDPKTGDIHHTAVVTSVTPDGVVHYTQHSDNKVNLSLQGRERHIEQSLGAQQFIVVRVDPAER